MLLNRKISIWYFINEVKKPVFFVCLFGLFISIMDLLPILQKISIPPSIPALLGTAVSLLLAFRTAQSYERWWEARTIWGAIVNDSRTLLRQMIQFVPENNNNMIREFADRQIIWVYALGESLRKQSYSPSVQAYLYINGIRGQNIPNILLDKHSEMVKQLAKDGIVTNFNQFQLNETIARLCDSMGKCERIKNTVFPRSYSLLVHTLIYVFAAILPFGMDDSQLIVEIVITMLLSIVFVAIEKTAIIMQDPFENTPVDTPMTALAQTIESNIREMTGMENVPVKNKQQLYYQM